MNYWILIPTAITIILAVLVLKECSKKTGNYAVDVFAGMIDGIIGLISAVVALISWLIYFIIF